MMPNGGMVMPVTQGMPQGRSRKADAGSLQVSVNGSTTGQSASFSAPPQPQELQRAFSISTQVFRVSWTVDGRKLKGNDKQAVSPPFELSFGIGFPQVTFKMMIYPKQMSDAKGGASFKKAKGVGFVQLKCEAELSEALSPVNFRISVGKGDKLQPARGPVLHNFAQSAVAGLPKDKEAWNFNDVLDQDSQTFVVTLEIVPQDRC
jgi:hypothetical protein